MPAQSPVRKKQENSEVVVAATAKHHEN